MDDSSNFSNISLIFWFVSFWFTLIQTPNNKNSDKIYDATLESMVTHCYPLREKENSGWSLFFLEKTFRMVYLLCCNLFLDNRTSFNG